MVKNRDDVIKTILENREAIRRFGVRKLGLFGSFARGENKSTSDLDFIIDLEKKSFDAYMDLKLFLEKIFNCHVDLVLTSTLKPRLRSEILKEAVYAPEF